jgi:hypothetical protein
MQRREISVVWVYDRLNVVPDMKRAVSEAEKRFDFSTVEITAETNGKESYVRGPRYHVVYVN